MPKRNVYTHMLQELLFFMKKGNYINLGYFDQNALCELKIFIQCFKINIREQ